MSNLDRYDAMDVALNGVSKKLKTISSYLKKNGIPVKGCSEGDYDVDAEIEIKENLSVQVCLDGSYIVNSIIGKGDDMSFRMSPEIRTRKHLVDILKKEIEVRV